MTELVHIAAGAALVFCAGWALSSWLAWRRGYAAGRRSVLRGFGQIVREERLNSFEASELKPGEPFPSPAFADCLPGGAPSRETLHFLSQGAR